MITLYLLKQSRAQRIGWALEELQLDYHIEIFERDAVTHLAPSCLKAVHPLGKSPILTDGNFTLAESGAILQYLVEQYGKGRLQPSPQSADYYAYLQWLHYAEGSIMPALMLSMMVNRIEDCASKQALKAVYVDAQVPLHLGYVEQALEQRQWLVNDRLSMADIAMSFPLQVAMCRSELARIYPNIARYVQQIYQHPSFIKAEQRLGKLALDSLNI